MMKQQKTALFFSNPFGFGPTGKAVALIKEFKKHWDGQIIFACSEFCETLISDQEITIITLNERDEQEIEQLLLKIHNPYVISCLNRFAIKVAHKHQIPCVMIDSLMWFWNKVHDDFALADYYYVQNLPGSEENIPQELQHKVILVPAIVGDLPIRQQSDHLLIHIGGCQNPLYKGLQTYYLDLLEHLLNNVPQANLYSSISVAGGTTAIDYLKGKNLNVQLESLDRDRFLQLMASAKHFVTTSGLTATLEAFSIGVPTSFYLPSNLSQWALLGLLQKFGATENFLAWEDYIPAPENFRRFSEGEAIPVLEKAAKEILENPQLLEHVTDNFIKLVTNIPAIDSQTKLIQQIGIDGVKKIVEDLKNKWDF